MHAKNEAEKSREDPLALAHAVWEGVLRSVAKSSQRSSCRRQAIQDLDAYLFGPSIIALAVHIW